MRDVTVQELNIPINNRRKCSKKTAWQRSQRKCIRRMDWDTVVRKSNRVGRSASNSTDSQHLKLVWFLSRRRQTCKKQNFFLTLRTFAVTHFKQAVFETRLICIDGVVLAVGLDSGKPPLNAVFRRILCSLKAWVPVDSSGFPILRLDDQRAKTAKMPPFSARVQRLSFKNLHGMWLP